MGICVQEDQGHLFAGPLQATGDFESRHATKRTTGDAVGPVRLRLANLFLEDLRQGVDRLNVTLAPIRIDS